ncbi:uncharacterized protein LOC118753463 [Rhagoletis pomonella]|uniref:uncharacterized protein LOC118753463 n=1 Tax=Rhagoletis pomonella TaxID=28610 RepID=UPI0017858DF5|nr:uncharacterized protein LOC118753463 [Rhagoletis pomonella]
MWPKELVELLLIKYQEHENLYNVRHPHYLDRVKRSKSLFEIHNEIKEKNANVTVEDIKKKVHTLRSQYIKELREVAMSKRSGVGIEDVYIPKLWCFDQLQFLKAHCATRKSTSNNSSVDDCDENSSVTISNENSTVTHSADNNSKTGVETSRKRKATANLDQQIKGVKSLLEKRLDDRSDYDWLGQQVIFEFKSIKNEDLRAETAWKIQTILREAKLKDKSIENQHIDENFTSEFLNDSMSSTISISSSQNKNFIASSFSLHPISNRPGERTTRSPDTLQKSLDGILDDEDFFE